MWLICLVHRRYDQEDPPLRQGYVIRSHALRILHLLSESIAPRALELDNFALLIICGTLNDTE
jgi:hypothetical protein